MFLNIFQNFNLNTVVLKIKFAYTEEKKRDVFVKF